MTSIRIINLAKKHRQVKLLWYWWLGGGQHGVGVQVHLPLNSWEEAIVILHLNHGVLQVTLVIGE